MQMNILMKDNDERSNKRHRLTWARGAGTAILGKNIRTYTKRHTLGDDSFRDKIRHFGKNCYSYSGFV